MRRWSLRRGEKTSPSMIRVALFAILPCCAERRTLDVRCTRTPFPMRPPGARWRPGPNGRPRPAPRSWEFLLDLEDGRRLWFTNTDRFPVHYIFARDHIPRTVAVTRDHDAFNRIQYREAARRFEMGSLVHYLDSDEWTMELVSGDTLDGERIVSSLSYRFARPCGQASACASGQPPRCMRPVSRTCANDCRQSPPMKSSPASVTSR